LKQRKAAEERLRNEKHEARLRESHLRAESAEMKARLLETRQLMEKEQLRSRIASDLHDEIGGNLSSIAILGQVVESTDSALSGKNKQRLKDIQHIARMTAESMRDIVWFINPKNDNHEEFIQQMRRTANTILQNMKVHFVDNTADQQRPFDINKRRNIFLIFKESLNNIARHSGARKVVIEVVSRDSQFELNIRDDGRGFQPDTKHDGNGLRNIRKRADELNAELKLDTQAGHGTEIRLSMKIP
jgi:signal transduction histidine kinase